MQTDKDDDKYEGPDESEYHFSDDETGFDTIESETTESSHPDEASTSEGKKSFFAGRSAPSKRMVITTAVLLGLVFIVYKMVAPSSQVVSTDITPVTSVAPKAMPAQPPAPTVAQMTPPPAVVAPPPAPSVQTPSPVTAAAPPAPPAPTVAQEQMTPPAPAQPAPPQQPVAPTGTAATNQLPGMPAVIEVQPPQSYQANQQVAPPAQPLSPTDARIAEMQANSDKLAAQMQADYTQKVADFQAQNKMLEDQVQTLNARISTMETELTQLVETLTKQNQSNAVNMQRQQQQQQIAAHAREMESVAESHTAAETRVAYTVQAIIPGRAWLRADNGETITVAEGDSVKNLGKVSKIDPYDGVVEINTGLKIISLSYGTAA